MKENLTIAISSPSDYSQFVDGEREVCMFDVVVAFLLLVLLLFDAFVVLDLDLFLLFYQMFLAELEYILQSGCNVVLSDQVRVTQYCFRLLSISVSE